MRVMLALCPNIIANNQQAAKAPFQKRHFFYCDQFVDGTETRRRCEAMIQWREQIGEIPWQRLMPVTIIDGDPWRVSGFNQWPVCGSIRRAPEDAGSPTARNRAVLLDARRLASISADYYQTGNFRWGTPAESVDIMEKLKELIRSLGALPSTLCTRRPMGRIFSWRRSLE